MSPLQEAIFNFASGDFTVIMMIGAAIGGGYVLGVAKRSLSKAFVGALGGASAVLVLWVVAKLITLAAGLAAPLSGMG